MSIHILKMRWIYAQPSIHVHICIFQVPNRNAAMIWIRVTYIGLYRILNSASCAASVAQLVELQPRTLKVVGSSPTQGSNFSLEGCCLGI